MGRRKNNPGLVQELIDGRWTMDPDEFDKKYASLSSSDMTKVGDAIDGMEDEFMNWDNDGDEEDGEDDGEELSAYDASLIWASNGKDEDYSFGYTEDELEDAFRR